MRFCLNTDCLGYMPFEEMLDTLAKLGDILEKRKLQLG